MSAEGKVFAARGGYAGVPLDFAEIPSHLVDAVLAVEDRRFFDHEGIDIRGIARAAFANIRAGGIREGGSTITQQLAKLMYLTPKRTLRRKIQEFVLAIRLEHRLTKTQILASYLDQVYLGAGVYGVRAAARRYFGKPVSQLTLAEASMLAGLIKAPSVYAPTTNPVAAGTRADRVLEAMAEAGFLGPDKQDRARAEIGDLARSIDANVGSGYFIDWIADRPTISELRAHGDIEIATTLVPVLQRVAEDTVADHLLKHGELGNVGQAALIAMTPDGAIVAMVGEYNRASQAARQPGSAFKLFVYLAALESSITPDTVVFDSPLSIDGWRPVNFSGRYLGAMTARDAFAKSINTTAAELGVRVGVHRVARLGHRLGIRSNLREEASLVLGTSEVTLLELTAAYAAMANGGNLVRPYGIERISRHGHELFDRSPTVPQEVLSPRVCAPGIELLQAAVRDGTGRNALLERQVAGKTGTSQRHRDAWFIGFTEELVVGIWVGNDNNAPMTGVSGGTLPAHIWRDFIRSAYAANSVPKTINGVGIFERAYGLRAPEHHLDARSSVGVLERTRGMQSRHARSSPPAQPASGCWERLSNDFKRMGDVILSLF
jgi:1A family penicillin-binding protein